MRRLGGRTNVAVAAFAAGLLGMLFGCALVMEPLDHDEFQHLFLAWNNAQGERLYADTFDTHGPLYTLINTVVFSLTGPPTGSNVYTLFRAGSLLALLGIVTQVVRTARHLTDNSRTAYLSGLLFLTLTPVMDKGVEIRPDVLQNLLWMTCVATVATDLAAKDLRRYGMAGVLLGLAGATNTKAALGALALGCFFVVQLVLEPARRRERLVAYLTLVLSALVVFALLFVPFVFSGTLAEALHYTLVAPFYLAAHYDTVAMPPLLPVLTSTQTLFTLCVLIGCYGLLRGHATVATEHRRYLTLLAGITAFGTLQVGHAQILLISLPLLSIVAAIGLAGCLRRFSNHGLRWALLLAVVAPNPAAHMSVLIARNADRQEQNRLLEYTLSHVPRGEPIGVVWNDCGGYSFNPGTRFLWMGNYTSWRSEQMYRVGQGDKTQFQAVERGHLAEGETRWVVGRLNSFHMHDLGEDGQRYLAEHFTSSHGGCLWTRKSGASD